MGEVIWCDLKQTPYCHAGSQSGISNKSGPLSKQYPAIRSQEYGHGLSKTLDPPTFWHYTVIG